MALMAVGGPCRDTMWRCPLPERVGKGQGVVIPTAEREGLDHRICLCSAQPSFPLCLPRGCGKRLGWGTWPCATFQHVCLPHPDVLACCPRSWPHWDISQAAGRAVPLCLADHSKPQAVSLKRQLQRHLGLGPGSPVPPRGTGPSPPPPTFESCQHQPAVLLEALAQPGLAPCALAGDTRTP